MFIPRHWTVARQLGMGFGLLLTLTLVIATVASWGLQRAGASLKSVYEDRTVPVQQLGKIRYLNMRQRVVLTDALMLGDPANTAKRITEFRVNETKVRQEWTTFKANSLTEDERILAATVEKAMQTLSAEGFAPMAQALEAGQADTARQLLDGRVSPLNPAFTEAMNQLIALQVRVAGDEFEAAQATTQRLQIGLLVIGLGALGLGAALGTAITRRLVGQLGGEPSAPAQ